MVPWSGPWDETNPNGSLGGHFMQVKLSLIGWRQRSNKPFVRHPNGLELIRLRAKIYTLLMYELLIGYHNLYLSHTTNPILATCPFLWSKFTFYLCVNS